METTLTRSRGAISRRSFMNTGLVVGAAGAGMLTRGVPAFADGGLRRGDAAILGFLAALEFLDRSCGSSTTSSPASRTTKFPAAAGTRPTPRLSRCWTRT